MNVIKTSVLLLGVEQEGRCPTSNQSPGNRVNRLEIHSRSCKPIFHGTSIKVVRDKSVEFGQGIFKLEDLLVNWHDLEQFDYNTFSRVSKRQAYLGLDIEREGCLVNNLLRC